LADDFSTFFSLSSFYYWNFVDDIFLVELLMYGCLWFGYLKNLMDDASGVFNLSVGF
jgi:hypothetical protein